MAKKTTEIKTLERTYNIPLRKEYLKVANWKRTKKAVSAVRQFLKKHMKAEEVKLGKHLNEELWKHGIKNPPHHIKVTAIKDEKEIIRAELFGHKIDTGKKEEKKKPSKLQEIAKKAGIKTAKKEEKPVEEKKKEEKPVVETKKEEKKEEPTVEKKPVEKKQEEKPKGK